MATEQQQTPPTRRFSKSRMMRILVVLLIIIILLYFFGGLPKRSKQILVGTGIVAVTALWIEVFDYDLDLETLWKTGDIQESRVQNVKWVKLVWSCVVKDASDDLNCANFTTQSEAQAVYEKCVDKIKEYNSDVDDEAIKKLDFYGLDGDKDGTVCEHLPAN